MYERRVDGPTMKKLRERKSEKTKNFRLNGTPFESVMRATKEVGGIGLAVYLAIRLTCKMRGSWSSMPKHLQEMLSLDSARYSKIVGRLEERGLILVKRERGRKLQFALPEDLQDG